MDIAVISSYHPSMTHDSAVRIVVSLVPEIGTQGAEGVLTKYASEQDLPPAQLEKLGQVYNTLRTVSHIDNADNDSRGASVPLLDVPEMVVGYATGLGQEKVAHTPLSSSSHDPSIVDLNVALMRELQDAPIVKAASAPVEAKPTVTKADFADAMMDLEIDLRDEMSKLASSIFVSAPKTDTWERDISHAEKEALYLQPLHLVKAAAEFMDEFAAPHRVELNHYDCEVAITKRAYDISDKAGEEFAKLADVVGTYQVIVKMAAEATVNDTLPMSPEDEAAYEAQIAASLGALPALEPSKEDPDAPERAPEGEKSVTETLNENKDLTSESDSKTEEGKENPNVGGEEADPEKSTGKGGGEGSKGKSKGDGGGSVSGAAVMGAVKAPFRAAAGAVQGAASKANDLLTNVTSKERTNASQKATDVSVEDIRRSMNLRRMIGTDPVLKEADPAEVLEVYNSIAQKNPEIANDMASLRLILREAVTYEGLTLDSQKMLSDIRKNTESGEQAASENDKKRYSVGGASPIQITTK